MSNALFEPEKIDLSELDMPGEAPPKKPFETKEAYKERTGCDYQVKRKKSQMPKWEKSSDEITELKLAGQEPAKVQLDPTEIRVYGKRMLSFLQSKELVVKFLTTELGITSDEAEKEVNMMLGEIRADFMSYITGSAEQNIMTLREMTKLALERRDTRSATEIIRLLDTMTNRYLEDHDMIPEKKKKEDDKEIEITFS
ncbi:MAG: hypothetical protein J6T96_00160 [Bacteroidales bacterium]|nr:hypothetical protein [Bacteroidales bacterium]